MNKQEYYKYLLSPEWRAKADAAKLRAGYRCQVCNKPSSEAQLDAHHRTYEHIGHEWDSDITVLCHKCHELFEGKKKAEKQPKHQKKRIKGHGGKKHKYIRENYGTATQITSQKGWRNRPRQINWDEE